MVFKRQPLLDAFAYLCAGADRGAIELEAANTDGKPRDRESERDDQGVEQHPEGLPAIDDRQGS